MGWRWVWGWVVLSLVWISPARADGLRASSVRENQSCATRLLSRIRKFATYPIPKKALAALVVGATVSLGSWGAVYENLHHDAWAKIAGREHAGFGIYFDPITLRAALPENETAILDGAKNDPLPLVRLLLARLSGDYDYSRVPRGSMPMATGENYRWYSRDYPSGIDAAHFLVSNGLPRGTCRHKAAVMAAILNHAGVSAQYAEVRQKQDGPPELPLVKHAVVLIPSLRLVADPDAGSLVRYEDYLHRGFAEYFVGWAGNRLADPLK